jgi:hypothetical protein
LLAATPATAKVRHVHKLHIRHHVDPVRAFPKPRHGRRVARASVFATTWGCDQALGDRAPLLSNAPQIKVIYVYAAGAPDNLATYGNLIQNDAATIENKVATESNNTKSVRFDVGGTGGPCTADSRNRLDIQTVQLAQPASFYLNNTFDTVEAELESDLVPADPHQRVNYVVYLDNVHPSDTNVAGQGDLGFDETHGYANPINQGRNGNGQLFAMIYGLGGSDFVGGYGDGDRQETFLHEMSHTLGAVQMGAPHSSGAGHCYDEQDIMCYWDGGPYFTSGGDLTYDPGCAGVGINESLDCNKDDYFSPNPSAGSYLATHWNEYDSVFLCPIAECDSTLPTFTVSVSKSAAGGKLTLTADAGGQPIQHYEWDLDGDGIYEYDAGSSPTFSPPSVRSGTIQMRAVKADGSFAYGSTTIRIPAPAVSVSGDLTIGGTVRVDASGTQDPDGLIKQYRWDLDGNGSFETDSGTNQVVTTSYNRAGLSHVALSIDYGFGTASTDTYFNIAGPIAPPAVVPPQVPPSRPTVSVTTVNLRQLVAHGLRLVVRCGAICTARFTLQIDAKTARKLHIKTRHGRPVVIGRIRGQYAIGATKPYLVLSGVAKSALRHAKTLKATLTGSIAQQYLKTLVIKKPLRFKR